MKIIDKFLKKLNASRNTFATYILTLITAYLVVDRVVEMLLMIFTGVSYSYWGPIQYTLALACPVFAFLFSGKSEFATSNAQKVSIFYIFVIALAVIAISMFMQWLNLGVWLFLISVPGYSDLVVNFSELFRPALTAISAFIPIVIGYKVFNFLYFGVNDSLDQTRSIWDYGGIDLSDQKDGRGPYTCEVFLCKDKETGKTVTIPETSRYQSLFVCGGSGSGKTSLVFEPLIARDLERKFFFREVSKELGYTALKTGIAYLNRPYDNEYLNANFNLNMLIPAEGKETIYKTFMKKMILSDLPEMTYKNNGITVLSPDKEISDHMISVCKNFQIPYNIIDPQDSNSIGLNPFVYDDPNKIAITISSALRAMYNTQHSDLEEAYREDLVIRAIENVSILLKEMYPRMNEGALPNLEDMLKMFTNFDLIEKMCEIMAHDDELREKYSVQLSYFKKYFYKTASAKDETERIIYAAVSQLDNLLRIPGVKNILCNRFENINFDDMLANGEVTFVCTRRGDLGSSGHKAFGLFFLISMENAVLRRPGNEKSRVPHFLYIDEFPDFICRDTEAIFTMYRKYKIATTISAQNLSQLETPTSRDNYRKTILANCVNKIFTGNGVKEDLEWWEIEFGKHREWVMSNTIDFDKMKYDSKHSGVVWKFVDNFNVGKLQGALGDKDCAYKIKDIGGKFLIGPGKLNYLESKYKEPRKVKVYDFGKYSDGVTTATEDDNDTHRKTKFNPKKLDFMDERNEINPIQTDTSDSNYLFDNEDAIIVNFKKDKKS